jgi:hypothetical protein
LPQPALRAAPPSGEGPAPELPLDPELVLDAELAFDWEPPLDPDALASGEELKPAPLPLEEPQRQKNRDDGEQ